MGQARAVLEKPTLRVQVHLDCLGNQHRGTPPRLLSAEPGASLKKPGDEREKEGTFFQMPSQIGTGKLLPNSVCTK